jgi:hypothetical protein
MAKVIKKTRYSKDGKYKFDNWYDDETGETGVDIEYERQDGTKRRNELERKKPKK